MTTNNLVDDFNTLNTLNEILENNSETLNMIDIASKKIKFEQKGGGFMDAVLSVAQHIMDVVKKVLKFIFIDLLFDQIFVVQDTFKRKAKRSGLWKYIVWSAKCGLYLVIFAIAGPIVLLIGISMIYSKLLKKIADDPNATPESFVTSKLAEAST